MQYLRYEEINNIKSSNSNPSILDENLEDFRKVLNPFKDSNLETLNLNHNQITDDGAAKIKTWINDKDDQLKIQKINLYNNRLKKDNDYVMAHCLEKDDQVE